MKKTLFILALITLAFSLKAQVIFKTITPQVPVTVGESFQVQYIIEESETVSNFKPAVFKNFRIVAGPNIYSGSVTTGNQVKQLRNLVYTLAAIKPGHFIIAGATATVNGKPEQSNDAFVEIISKEEAAKIFNKDLADISPDYFLRSGEDAYEKIRKNLFLKMTVNRKTCYVGEPVLATFKLYSRLESKSDIVKNPGFYGFTVYDMINLSDKESATEYVKGKLFDVHTIRKVQLYPLQEGTFTIDAMEIKNEVEFSHSAVYKKKEQEIVEGILRNDNNEIPGNEAEVFETNISTEPVVITVKPPPAKTKPAAFSGATGVFNISAAVAKDKLSKDEEGVLEVTISGKGNFTQLNTPVVEWPTGIEGFEPAIKDVLDKSKSPLSGSRTFRYGFVSAKPAVYTIPSIVFSFFDPGTNKYKTITSSALQVKITNEKKVNLRKPEIKIETKNVDKKYWVVCGAVLLLCMAGLFLFYLKRKKNSKQKQAQPGATKLPLSISEILAASLIASPMDKDFYSSLYQSMWKLFSYYFNLSGSEMNKINLAKRLKENKISEKLVDDTLQILQECESGMFTNASLMNDKNELLQKAKKLFAGINTALQGVHNN